MNTDPADTRSPHLDLEDLIAEAAGQPVAGRTREHLAGCARCQLEANRWTLVGDAVRGLAAGMPEVPQPARPRRTRRRRLPRPVRYAMMASGSVAAALALLLAIGSAVGVVHVHLSGGGPATLTAVTGCDRLEQANGTLDQVHGSTVVIKTASGQLVTVTTTAATKVGEGGPLTGDITDGAPVTVIGRSSGGTIAAIGVIIADTARQHPQPGPGLTYVRGTVADASAAGFTVVTPGRTRLPVTTSSNTLVSVTNASLSQLPTGATTYAVGSAGPHGTLSARGIVAILQLPQGGLQPHAQEHVQVKNCSPASIDHAIMALTEG